MVVRDIEGGFGVSEDDVAKGHRHRQAAVPGMDALKVIGNTTTVELQRKSPANLCSQADAGETSRQAHDGIRRGPEDFKNLKRELDDFVEHGFKVSLFSCLRLNYHGPFGSRTIASIHQFENMLKKYRIRLPLILLVIVCTSPGMTVEPDAVRDKLNDAWKVTWDRFYREDTHLFYDYLSSYEPGKELAHLPTKDEVLAQNPNECGYGTGMEDGMISAGVMLSLVVDRFAVTSEDEMRDHAKKVYLGIRNCVTEDGFVARAVCHEDLQCFYPNSSRDQYTHAVHGLWHYAKSPLCDEETRTEIGELLSRISDRMIRNVTPENNYDSLRADGSRDTRGISLMWNVNSHEWARLPMIYAATWDVTGDEKYRDLWRKYIREAIEKSKRVPTGESTYALLQMQISLELLAELEPDERLKADMEEIQAEIADVGRQRLRSAHGRLSQLDLTAVCGDWRTTAGLSAKGTYRPVWYAIRECGEAALTQLVNGQSLEATQRELLYDSIKQIDFDRVSSNGIFFLQAAYWKDRKSRQLKE